MTTTKNAIGDIGECFVQEFHGPNFILSEDKFDRVKDGVLGSMTAEIKTLTRMRNKPEYWLELNQYDKVSSVDLFFIVDIPIYANEGSKIYLCPNNKNLQIENRVKNGNVCKMVIIPEEKLAENPSLSFPGKLLQCLFHRFKILGNTPESKLVVDN